MAKKKQTSTKHKKKAYHIKNWASYDRSLQQRGSLEFWVEEGIADHWYALPAHTQGAQPRYTDTAITTTLQLGMVFGQRLRQTEGFVRSIFRLLRLDLDVPDHSTLSRRGAVVKVKIPKKKRKEKLVFVVDGSGLKVYGEGEWKVRQHGKAKRRTWRKIQLGVTPDGEIRAVELTTNEVSDDEALVYLLAQETMAIAALAADGAYDKRKVYALCRQRHIKDIRIPPRKDARIWTHGNSHAPPHPRDENLRVIRATSRKSWKETAGYHVRSLAETAVFRLKTIFGDRLHARNMAQQRTEAFLKVAALNRMWSLGTPDSYAVAG